MLNIAVVAPIPRASVPITTRGSRAAPSGTSAGCAVYHETDYASRFTWHYEGPRRSRVNAPVRNNSRITLLLPVTLFVRVGCAWEETARPSQVTTPADNAEDFNLGGCGNSTSFRPLNGRRAIGEVKSRMC